MILQDLELHNFRPYKGRSFIAFSGPGSQNVTLIEGIMGTGKTSLFNAINWVLYGSAAIDKKFQIVNRDVAREATESQKAKSVVHLRFRHSGHLYKLTRSVTGYWQADKYFEEENPASLWVTRPDGNAERESEVAVEINRMLPAAIRTFFFFNGDKIGEFTRPGREANQAITAAVNEVLQLRPLAKGVEDLRTIARTCARQLAQAPAPQLTSTKNMLNLLQIEERRNAAALAEVTHERDELSMRQSLIEDALTQFIEISRQATERSKATMSLRSLEERGKNLRFQLAAECSASAVSSVSARIGAAEKFLMLYKTEHGLPSNIQAVFLRQLLHTEKCICDRPIVRGSREEQRLTEILNSTMPGSLQDRATTLLAQLSGLESGKVAEERLTTLMGQIRQNDVAIDRVQKSIESLGGEIDAAKHAEARALNAEMKRNSGRLQELAVEIARLEREVRENARRQSEKHEQIRVESLKQGELKEQAVLSGLTNDCLDILDRIHGALENRIRKALSDEATRILLAFAVGDDEFRFFKRVEVGADYLISVFNDKGEDIRAGLSEGQTQLLSLSFFMAMTRLGGQEAPLVIDTPTARLSGQVRVNIARDMPGLASQLVFLATDTENTQQFNEHLKPRIGLQYVLRATAEGSTISEMVNAEN